MLRFVTVLVALQFKCSDPLAKKNLRYHSFYRKVANLWNVLPVADKSSASFSSKFKIRLETF